LLSFYIEIVKGRGHVFTRFALIKFQDKGVLAVTHSGTKIDGQKRLTLIKFSMRSQGFKYFVVDEFVEKRIL
jgi:hypothetical protein